MIRSCGERRAPPSPLLAAASQLTSTGHSCRHHLMAESFFSEVTGKGVDKSLRYGWKDPGPMGSFRLIHKSDLRIDSAYQRASISLPKVTRITSCFDWKSFGVLHVAARQDGQLFVFDGQHRMLAAKRRSDVDMVPCMVFAAEGVSSEASAFLSVNTNRKPIGSFSRHKALLASNDPLAEFVECCFHECGLTPGEHANTESQIKCLSICYTLASKDKRRFRDALETASRLAYQGKVPINERILGGLFWLAQRVEDFPSPRFQRRLEAKGLRSLDQAINRAAAFYTKGGERVYGIGILEDVNKGLQNKFRVSELSANE